MQRICAGTGWALGLYLLSATLIMGANADLPAAEARTGKADDQRNAHYVSNREPLLPSPLVKLPIGAIEPRGWMRTQLELQAEGFHGQLLKLSRFLDKEGNAWLNLKGEGSHGWEEVPYWLKGYSNCAYVLQNQAMIDEVRGWIEATLRSQKPDGWFGPDEGRKGVASRITGRTDLWPNMIMCFCLQDYYSFTGDERVIQLMTRYFQYLDQQVPADKLLNGYWPVMRGGDLLYSVLWLYNQTGEKWLLGLAEKVHVDTARWDEDVINWHNVNVAQGFGEPATYYVLSHDQKDLIAAERNWLKVRELYGQVPGGMFGGDENCRAGYDGPRQAIETCGIVEEMLSDETLLTITGNPIWADRCENAALNSLPAAFTSDLKALRYLTAPNQVLSDRHSKSPGIQNGGPMFLMDPHGHRCCQHNGGHGWPYYAQHLWLATADNGLAAVLYAPSRVTAKVGDGVEVTITEETGYPFDETVKLAIETSEPVAFPLKLRVPGWCESPRVEINGDPLAGDVKPRSYIVVNRTWNDGDALTLTLPMEIRVTRWPENRNTASVSWGALTFSLEIGEQYVRAGGTDEWPAWEILPTTAWNYGLVLDEEDPTRGFEITRKPMPSGQPFTLSAVPVAITARAKKIPNWKLDELGLVGAMQPGPIRSDAPTETITLIPMGAARLRISAFPVIGDGPEASEWPAPVEPDCKVTASHCFGGDTVKAAADGRLPQNSNDHSLPRMTWWDHRGSEEWVQYTFNKLRKLSRCEVYWFDDTGHGQCRVPQSWSIEYRDGETWKPVTGLDPDCPGTAPDTFNRVEFDAVETDAVRLRIQLKPNYSAGILEWRAE